MVTRGRPDTDSPSPAELLRRPQQFEDAASHGVREDLLGYLTRASSAPGTALTRSSSG